MSYFIHLFLNIMLPIFMLILAGITLKRQFEIDVKTLIKIQFNLVIPVMLFIKLYESKLSGDIAFIVILTIILVMSGVYILTYVISKLRGYTKNETNALVNSSTFFNSGNFSLPLMELLFENPLALSIQAIILLVHNILFFTIGIFNASSGRKRPLDAIKNILKMPLIYFISVAIALKSLNIEIWSPLWESMNILSGAFVPIALITLGAQLQDTKFKFNNARLYFSNFMRLIISPLLTYLVTLILGIEGLIAQVLIISAAAPTAVNVALTAIEFDNEPDFSSQAVLTSTILCSITMTFTIYLALKFV